MDENQPRGVTNNEADRAAMLERRRKAGDVLPFSPSTPRSQRIFQGRAVLKQHSIARRSLMARGNGSADLDFADRSADEAATAGDRVGLQWLAQRLRSVRIAILELTMRNQLSPELEFELRELETEFRRRVEENDE